MLTKRTINFGITSPVFFGRPHFSKSFITQPLKESQQVSAHYVPNRILKRSSASACNFFKMINKYASPISSSATVNFLSNEPLLKTSLEEVDSYIKGNYIHEHFISWLSLYSREKSNYVLKYLNGRISFELICKDFINFCFHKGIELDAQKTLEAFSSHNQLSDDAVKKELTKLGFRSQINLLGFGLDEGAYERNIADYLIRKNHAQNVMVFGFDPYAKKKNGIIYLDKNQLTNSSAPRFDLIIARWVLHHVTRKDRWDDLISCINKCNTNARVVIVEHGFLRGRTSSYERKMSDFLNATFDIIANIGLRPNYFSDSLPDLGANFFIQYLRVNDLRKIQNKIKTPSVETIYDVGPSFPNQTICSIQIC